MQVCQVTRIGRVTQALFELHTQKKKKENYRTFTHAFYNIREYIFQTSYVKFFLKTSVFYA